MKFLRSIALPAVFSLSMNLTLAQEVCLDSEVAMSSNYYTGETGAASLNRVSHWDWINRKYSSELGFGVLMEKPMLESSEINSYIDQVTQTLLNSWPGDTPDVQIFVAIDPLFEARYFHDTGEIVITSAVLDNLSSEDELAAIIAHEVAHALLQHEEKKRAFSVNRDFLHSATQLANYASIIKNTSLTKVGDSYDLSLDQEEFSEDYEQLLVKKVVLDTLNDDIWQSFWSRGSESDADELAFDLLVCAGYNIRGMYHFLEKDMEVRRKFRGAFANYLAVSTEAINESLETFDFDSALNQVFDVGVQATLSGIKGIATKVTADHKHPLTRRKNLNKYQREHYAREQLAFTLKKDSLLLLREGDAARQLELQKSANTAFLYLNDGNIAAAEEVLAQTNMLDDGYNSFTRYVEYKVARRKMGLRSSVNYLYEIPDIDQLPISMFRDIIDAYIELGDTETVSQLVSSGKERFIGEDEFLLQEISLARIDNNQVVLKERAEHCIEKNEARLTQICSQLAGIELQNEKSAPAKSLGGGLFNTLKDL